LKEAFTQYKIFKKDAEKLRTLFLDQLAESKPEATNQSKTTILRQLQFHKTMRSMFRKIKYSIRDRRNGVTAVEAPNEDGVWDIVTDKDTIKKKCIAENIRRLNGAGSTIWAMISTIVLNHLRNKKMGVTIQTSDSKTITIPAFAFVDDTDLFQELKGDIDFQSPQLAVNEWAQGIQTTGGLIIGEICFYQVVRHKWQKNRWEIQQAR
jgi:hypothetical protein